MLRGYWRLRSIIAPSLRYSQETYEQILDEHVTAGSTWLELGCGHQILPPWRADRERQLVARCKTVIGIDRDVRAMRGHGCISHRIGADLARLPVKDETFDLITANMVVEHLENPSALFQEVRRVLKADGLFIFHTPNALGYATVLARLVPRPVKLEFLRLFEGRPGEDVYPAFYRANTSRRIRRLSQSSGLEIQEIRMLPTDAVCARVLPLAALELVVIRLLMAKRLEALSGNLIGIMRKKMAFFGQS
jgi:SAM-dependent methyltransferase